MDIQLKANFLQDNIFYNNIGIQKFSQLPDLWQLLQFYQSLKLLNNSLNLLLFFRNFAV